MNFLFDNLPFAVILLGICLLMLYPYIGAGIMLAALCFGAGQYVLMAVVLVICTALHIIMKKHIKPHSVPVPPSRASRKRKRKKKRPAEATEDSKAPGAAPLMALDNAVDQSADDHSKMG